LRVASPLVQTIRRRTQRGRGICSLDQTPRSRKSRRSICFLEDALLDLTNCGDTVVDPFLGSGSTLIAAEKTERVCRGVEVDPLYVDVIARRYEAATGDAPTHIETGETFEALGARRATEAAPVQGGIVTSTVFTDQYLPLRGSRFQ
jgi:DNA methylase